MLSLVTHLLLLLVALLPASDITCDATQKEEPTIAILSDKIEIDLRPLNLKKSFHVDALLVFPTLDSEKIKLPASWFEIDHTKEKAITSSKMNNLLCSRLGGQFRKIYSNSNINDYVSQSLALLVTNDSDNDCWAYNDFLDRFYSDTLKLEPLTLTSFDSDGHCDNLSENMIDFESKYLDSISSMLHDCHAELESFNWFWKKFQVYILNEIGLIEAHDLLESISKIMEEIDIASEINRLLVAQKKFQSVSQKLHQRQAVFYSDDSREKNADYLREALFHLSINPIVYADDELKSDSVVKFVREFESFGLSSPSIRGINSVQQTPICQDDQSLKKLQEQLKSDKLLANKLETMLSKIRDSEKIIREKRNAVRDAELGENTAFP